MAYTIQLESEKRMGTFIAHFAVELAARAPGITVEEYRITSTIQLELKKIRIATKGKLIDSKIVRHSGSRALNDDDWDFFHSLVNKCLTDLELRANVWATPMHSKGPLVIRRGRERVLGGMNL